MSEDLQFTLCCIGFFIFSIGLGIYYPIALKKERMRKLEKAMEEEYLIKQKLERKYGRNSD